MKKDFMHSKIKPGDIYEACNCHPVLCTEVSYKDDQIFGISLIDGHVGNGCSLHSCGVIKLTVDQAMKIKTKGPAEIWKKDFRPKDMWWKKQKRSKST